MELASWFKSRCVEAVYSSPLSRCMETAEYIAGEQQRVHVEEGLVELDAGEWENMEFTEIRSRYPQLYEERGRSIGTVPPPGGESFARGAERLQDALNRILGNTRGDVAADVRYSRVGYQPRTGSSPAIWRNQPDSGRR